MKEACFILCGNRGIIMTIMKGVTEYCEEMNVELKGTNGHYTFGVPKEKWPGRGRLIIRALNESGYNSTEVDLLELLTWLKENRPDILVKEELIIERKSQ